MKTITFCVPSYNSEKTMKITLESLLKGGDSLEIIIIDDGSMDSTPLIADEYANKYPNIIKVIHQENGGHGAGINVALNIATGLFFKVVDSDDWVNEKALEGINNYIYSNIKSKDLPDLLITNYVYYYGYDEITGVINYHKVFPTNKLFTWQDIKHMNIMQNFTLHSCMYKTSILKEANVMLPKHIFYEDNYLIYVPMPFIKSLMYLNVDFYCYLIGREGQSVSYDASIRRYKDHINIATMIATQYDLKDIKKNNKALFKAMWHHVTLIMSIGCMYTILANTKESKSYLKQKLKELKNKRPYTYKKIRWRSKVALLINLGFLRYPFTRFVYWLAHKFVKFN